MSKVKQASGFARADSRLGRERLGVGHVRICRRRTAAAPHNNAERGGESEAKIKSIFSHSRPFGACSTALVRWGPH